MSSSGSKKRKRQAANADTTPANGIDTSKPTAVYRPTKGRPFTVSVALPGSIIANAQTHELKTSLCGNIARALSVFSVDEAIIFDDGCNALFSKPQDPQHAAQDAKTGYTAYSDPSGFLCHLLSYLETPPFMRKSLFPHHPDLRTAGSLPSLDIPSHLRSSDWCQYREGITVAAPTSNHVQVNGDGLGRSDQTYVQAGLKSPVLLSPSPEEQILVNTRVTLRFASSVQPKSGAQLDAEAVDPALPREEAGYYWGYSTRTAKNLADVFTECPFEGGYDYSIGTSERGVFLSDFLNHTVANDSGVSSSRALPSHWNHLLIVFGGPPGLEKAVQNDSVLAEKGVTEASELFDAWVNLVEQQGSKTIRTEEAVWIGLMGFSGLIRTRQATVEQQSST